MPEWLIEDGIGETRALLVENDQVVAAKLMWPGELRAGEELPARLISKAQGARRGTARTETGRDILVDHLPKGTTEGGTLKVRITRAAIAERGRFKLPQGRVIDEKVSQSGPPLFQNGTVVRQFPPQMWEEVWHAASSGELEFAGGGIVCSAAPAMTVIDVDCANPQDAVAASVPAISRALRWFDIRGNIGIDFPTITDKRVRKACDDRLAEHLSDWPHERTAMNGFGFVQIIARLEGPSLLHRFAASRTAMCARFAIRVAERAQGAGPVLLLRIHPALKAKLKPDWLEELQHRTGKQLRIETDPGLALEAPQAQITAL